LNPQTANYIQSSPKVIRNGAIVGGTQPVRTTVPVNYLNGKPLTSTTTNGVRRYGQPLTSGTTTYPTKSNTVYTPISSSPHNPVSLNAVSNRYSKENIQPVTRMINGKPVKVYTA
jgi:hypothetical protein